MEQYKRLILKSGRALLTLLLIAVFAYIWRTTYNTMIERYFHSVGNYLVYALYGTILYIFFKLYGAYRVGYSKVSEVLFSQFLALIFTNIVTYGQVSLIGRELMPPMPLVYGTLVEEAVLILWTVLMENVYHKLYPPKRMVIVYGTEEGRSLQKKISSRPDKFRIQEMVSIEEGLESIKDHLKSLHDIDAVVIADVKSETKNKLLKFCFEQGIQAYVTPKISDIIMRGARDVHLFDTTLYQCSNLALSFDQLLAKRAMDIVIAALALVIASPFMLLTIIAIKIEDGGPVFFRQKRCTKNERVFEILKFRSMVVGAEKDGEVKPATEKDPRITKVGRVIRPIRFDEIPQLINVLKGDMSLVGPRPERIEHVRKYEKTIPEFAYRHKVKAGLTGYAQIMGKYNTSAYDKLKLDLMYIENYSLFQDLKLLLMTIKILFKKESTEGFSDQ